MTVVIKPGLLVSLKSTVTGGVSYTRQDLAADDPALEGASVARWETIRTIDDPEEHEAACKVRSKALGMIRKVCSATAFGYLCPFERERALDVAVLTARAMIDEFNASARRTRVSVYVLPGRIASTDEEAARAIGAEVAELIGDMSGAIDALDPAAIRKAADKARELSAMLDEEQAVLVETAITQARKAARAIVSRVQKDGEAAAVVLADVNRGALNRARMAFLDVEDAPIPGESGIRASEPPPPAVDLQRFAELELPCEPEDAMPSPTMVLDMQDALAAAEGAA